MQMNQAQAKGFVMMVKLIITEESAHDSWLTHTWKHKHTLQSWAKPSETEMWCDQVWHRAVSTGLTTSFQHKNTGSASNLNCLFTGTEPSEKVSTCSHRPLPRQPQQTLLLEDEAASDEDAGADGQPQADVEIILPPVLSHSEAGCVAVVCHIYHQTMQLRPNGAVLASPDTWKLITLQIIIPYI